jgi:hypothetical protein
VCMVLMEKKKTSSLKQGSPIIVALIVSCIILITLASCHITSEDLQTISSASSETDISGNTASDTSVSDNENTSATEMAAGEIYFDFPNDNDLNSAIAPVAKWYVENILGEDESAINGRYNLFLSIGHFDEFTFEMVSYTLSSASDTEKPKYLLLLFGVEKNTRRYILIDGKVSVQNNTYSIKESWDKVNSHSVFGKYVNEFPQAITSEGMNELDLAALIGKNRSVRCSLYVDEKTIAVINTATSYNENGLPKSTDWKIDFIDIEKGSVISHKLKEIEGMGIDLYASTHYSVVENGFLKLYFYIPATETKAIETFEYKAKINTEANNEDIITTAKENEDIRYTIKLTSESGRYYSFYKDYDLYLHDNTTGKDTLIYDAYFDEDSDDSHKTDVAHAAFFTGDTLFFNMNGANSIRGNGYYDPATKKVKIYNNGIHVKMYSNGYIYGEKEEDDSLYRYHIDTPDTIETLDNGDIIATYFVSPNCQYIARILHSENENTSTLTVYTSADLKELKNYTLKSPFLSLGSSFVFMKNDYIYITAGSYALDDTAYVIKLGA